MNQGILQRDTSLECAVEYIRNAILEGTYKPGTQLKQSEIASLLGVSQGPTREALIHLVAEGLVENIPFKGMFVRKLTEKDIEEIYQIRTALESLAIQIALPLLKQEEHLHKLEQLMEETIEAEKSGNYSYAVLLDLNFHRYIVELSGNSRLLNFWDSLLAQSRYVLRNLYETYPATGNDGLAANHRLILDALRSKSYPEIQQVIVEHMNFAATKLIELVTSQDAAQSPAKSDSSLVSPRIKINNVATKRTIP